MTAPPSSEIVLDLVSEELSVRKREVETGRVLVHFNTKVETREVTDTLVSDTADVERVPVDRFVDIMPETRQEGDVLIVPLVEERLVKRLFLREELRISKRRDTSLVTATADLRREEATVERLPPSTPTTPEQEPRS